MERLRLGWKYIGYRLAGKTKHAVHSPFVYELITEVLESRGKFYAIERVEKLREQLLRSEEFIEVQDFGAGSKVHRSARRKISDIAATAAQPIRYGELLFRLVNRFRPATILELGTSLGISTAYMALPDSSAKVISIEGCPQTAVIARTNFEKLNLRNIDLRVGRFDKRLPEALHEIERLDFVFFDGDHRKEATLRYFETCLPKAHNDTVFVVDDIHWSAGMEEAWNIIKSNPEVTASIDLFFKGIVFFRKESEKEDFVIRF